MTGFCLYPPNAKTLSDKVIRAVTERSNPIHRQVQVNIILRPQAPYEVLTKPSLATEPETITEEQQDAIEEAVLRERHRVSQAKYRSKQRQLTVSLEAANSKLRQEIRELELKRCIACTGIPTTRSVWNVAMEYFRLFRFGFRSPPPALHAFVLKFLQESMAPDVTDGLICGVEALLKNWSEFSACFQDIDIQLEQLERESSVISLVATTTTSATISPNTLQRAFPHLVTGHERSDKRIVAKLVGQRISMRGSVRFEWGPDNDCVVRMQSRADMVTPLLLLLGNLADVSRVFDGAFVSPECRMITS